jgi:hypothetical protein
MNSLRYFQVYVFDIKIVIECESFEVFTAVTMNNVVFWDIKNPVRTSQET